MIDKTKDAVEEYDAPCAPCMLGDRVAFKRSVIYGLGVQEFEPTGKAASEVNALYKYVSNSLRCRMGKPGNMRDVLKNRQQQKPELEIV